MCLCVYTVWQEFQALLSSCTSENIPIQTVADLFSEVTKTDGSASGDLVSAEAIVVLCNKYGISPPVQLPSTLTEEEQAAVKKSFKKVRTAVAVALSLRRNSGSTPVWWCYDVNAVDVIFCVGWGNRCLLMNH